MSQPRIGRINSTVSVEPSRARQTVRPVSPFKSMLKEGAQVLLSGAQAATSALGLPAMSAAVSRARVGIEDGGVKADATADDPMKTMLDKRLDDDLKLLALQSEIQRHNRQVSLVSNVLKARHETAKSAIGNIRS